MIFPANETAIYFGDFPWLNHRFFFQPTHHVSRLETSHHQHRFLWHVWLGSAWTSRAVVVVVVPSSRPAAASRCSEASALDVCVPWRVDFGSIWCDLAVSKPIVPLFCSHQNSCDLWMFIPLRMVLIGIDPYPFAPWEILHTTTRLGNRWREYGTKIFWFRIWKKSMLPRFLGLISSHGNYDSENNDH